MERKDWQAAPIMQLANYFHRMDPEGHFRRIQRYEMSESYLNALKTFGDTSRIDICLAIDIAAPEEMFASFIVLKFYSVTKDPLYCKLEGRSDTNEYPLAGEIIPEIFKNMVHNNWIQTDMHLIDDLFIAQTDKGLVRVRSFIIEDVTPAINTLRSDVNNKIVGITLYPGVDMNKFGNNTLISFTPVLGFKTEQILGTLHYRGVLEVKSKELFVEYTRPCPPTCEKSFSV